MTSRFVVIVLFIASLVLDSIVVSGFLWTPESLLTLIFLVTFLVAHGEKVWVILYGIAFCIIIELSLGLYFGVLTVSWLVVVWLWHGLTQFFSLKSFRDGSISSILVHVIVSMLLLAVLVIVYAWLASILFDGTLWFYRLITVKLVSYYTAAVLVYLFLFHSRKDKIKHSF